MESQEDGFKIRVLIGTVLGGHIGYQAPKLPRLFIPTLVGGTLGYLVASTTNPNFGFK